MKYTLPQSRAGENRKSARVQTRPWIKITPQMHTTYAEARKSINCPLCPQKHRFRLQKEMPVHARDLLTRHLDRDPDTHLRAGEDLCALSVSSDVPIGQMQTTLYQALVLRCLLKRSIVLRIPVLQHRCPQFLVGIGVAASSSSSSSSSSSASSNRGGRPDVT